MIEVTITEQHIEEAEKLYCFNKLKNSITEGKSEIYGAIGEVISLGFFQAHCETVNYVGSYDYDLIVNGKKVDIKTKKVNNPPQPNHNATIPAVNTKQQTDIYFFVYVLSDKSKAFLVGWLNKESFFEVAELKKEGEFDGKTSFQYRADTYSTTLSKLNRVQIKINSPKK